MTNTRRLFFIAALIALLIPATLWVGLAQPPGSNAAATSSLTPPPDPVSGRATGTVSLSSGGTAVTGAGTHFTTEISVGQYLNFRQGATAWQGAIKSPARRPATAGIQ